jgi:leucyl aminopeptidase
MLMTLDEILGGQIKDLIRHKYFEGKAGKSQLLIVHPQQAFERLLLIGVGKSKEFTLDILRKAAGLAGQRGTENKTATVGFIMPELRGIKGITSEQAAQATVEGVNLGSYFLDTFRSGEKERSKPAKLSLLVSSKSEIGKAQSGAKIGLIVSDMQNYCRDLSGYPSNVLTPGYLANEARRLGRQHGLKVQVFGRSQIEKLKMGAFLAVAKGSAEEPKLIRIDYVPRGKAKKRVILVGKGITFDTGGITLKPGADMHEMKGDMTGAAAVLGSMVALAQLKPRTQVTGFIPTCENMPGSRAFKPGDVLTTCIGKTIEVISTDAEGRLLLADVLGYAAKMKPDYLIDIATLTGAVIVALGHVGAAMLSTSDDLLKRANAASNATGEKLWQLPLWQEFEHQIKSSIADIKASGGKPGGTITASLILKKFVGDVPWMHLDIAGMDIEFRGYEYMPKGPSGFGVRLLTEMLCRME